MGLIRLPGSNVDCTDSRSYWLAQYPVKDVMRAAQYRLGHHHQRKSFWAMEKENLEKKVKDSLKIDDPAGQFSSSNYNAGSIKFDQDTASAWHAADAKYREHSEKAREVAYWVVFLGRLNPEDVLELNYEDVVFFEIGRE